MEKTLILDLLYKTLRDDQFGPNSGDNAIAVAGLDLKRSAIFRRFEAMIEEPAAPSKTDPQTPRWEYTELVLGDQKMPADRIGAANTLGQLGWKLIGTSHDSKGTARLWFERAVPND